MRILLLVLAIAASALAQAPNPDLEISLLDVQGEADVQLAANANFEPATKGTKLTVGASICTGSGGMVTLAFGTNSVAVVRQATLFTVRSFAMQGGRLVANVYINPGVCNVSVKQLAQYVTDFTVSTPRLTASVRGCEEEVTANGDELPDTAVCRQHSLLARFLDGRVRRLVAGMRTNSRNASPDDLGTIANLSRILPIGGTDAERRDVEGLVMVNEGAPNLPSDLSRYGSNPAMDNTGEVAHCSERALNRDLGFISQSGFRNISEFLRSGDNAILPQAQLELSSLHDSGQFDVHDAVHRAIDCAPFGTPLAH